MGTRRDKLMSKRRKIILMRLNPKTTKQYRIYASDLERCIKFFIIIFFEDIQGDEIDLKLSNFISNKLMIHNPKERSKKTSLKFSSIEYKINTIKSTPIDFQKFTNLMMSSSRSKENEVIRKKKDILLKKDAAQRSSIINED